MLDSAGFSDLRSYLKRRLAYGRYRVGSTWTRVQLTGVDIQSNGIVRARMNINSGGSAITVNRAELYNTDGSLFAHQDCSIAVSAGQTGILFWFDFNITESEEDV